MNKWRENWEHEHGQINRNQTNKKQYGRAEQRTNRVTLNLSCLIISPIIMMADNMIDRMNILYVHVIDTLWCFDWQKIDEHFCVEASQICFLYATRLRLQHIYLPRYLFGSYESMPLYVVLFNGEAKWATNESGPWRRSYLNQEKSLFSHQSNHFHGNWWRRLRVKANRVNRDSIHPYLAV